MKRMFFALASAVAALGAASPSYASVVLTTVNGPNLTTHIKASATDAQNNNPVVYGSTLNSGQSADVTFTANTAVHITDGAGYAAISDAPGNTTLFTAITSNPVPDFNAYQFSIQLVSDSFILVQYQLSGSGTWQNALLGPDNTPNPFAQNANTNRDYQITGTGGEAIDSIRISTCLTSTVSSCNQTGTGAGTGGGIFLFKQNSINLATTPLPEPGTWAMMLLGFAGIGTALRRNRRRNTVQMRAA